MNVINPMGVLQSFSLKNIFYDKMDLRIFYFHVTMLLFCFCFFYYLGPQKVTSEWMQKSRKWP